MSFEEFAISLVLAQKGEMCAFTAGFSLASVHRGSAWFQGTQELFSATVAAVNHARATGWAQLMFAANSPVSDEEHPLVIKAINKYVRSVLKTMQHEEKLALVKTVSIPIDSSQFCLMITRTAVTAP